MKQPFIVRCFDLLIWNIMVVMHNDDNDNSDNNKGNNLENK